ncbi:MAG: metallophosphoesterase [Terracidiphilus sp.]
MRTAIVSDIHGNLTAFEAVLEDLRQTAPDLILHGGDLAQGGARPAEIVDLIRDLGASQILRCSLSLTRWKRWRLRTARLLVRRDSSG